jgi:hypothetical protein
MTPAKREIPTQPIPAIDAVTIGRIAQAVDNITSATDKITSAIYDRDGLAERTLKIEQAALRLKEEAEAVKEFRAHTTAVLDSIKDSVNSHHCDKSLHSFGGLVLHKNVLTVILVIFLILHSLIPPDLSLFDLIRKLAGL